MENPNPPKANNSSSPMIDNTRLGMIVLTIILIVAWFKAVDSGITATLIGVIAALAGHAAGKQTS
jgi:Na+/H+ antiporter NhaA